MSDIRPTALSVMVVDPGCITPAYDSELCSALARDGQHVTLVTAPHQNDRSHRFPPGFNVAPLFFSSRHFQRFGRWRKFAKGVTYPWYYRRLLGRLGDIRPDVIHYQWLLVPPIDLAYMRKIRRRSPSTVIVMTMHDVQPLALIVGQGYLEQVLSFVDGIVVHGRASRGQLLQRFPDLEHKVFVIPHGPLHMDDARAGTDNSISALAGRLADNGKHVGLFFGEIKDYKGLGVLADAVTTLREHDKRRLSLVVAGKLEEPASQKDLIRLANLGVEVDLRIGYVSSDDVSRYFQAADFVLLPYKAITQSGVLLTAISHGRPVIASALGDMTELVRTTGAGWTVQAGDPASLSAALHDVVNLPRAELRRVGQSARQALLAQFGWDKVAPAAVDCYRQLIRQRSPGAGTGAYRPG